MTQSLMYLLYAAVILLLLSVAAVVVMNCIEIYHDIKRKK